VKRRLVLLLIAVLAVKVIFLALDSQPTFHLGGSAIYLATAIGKWIPPDHGFVYGFLLRFVAVWARSLTPMVLTQAALSAIASWLVGVCLLRYFASGFRIAALCALACAVEPLQLAAERSVSAESIATFVFAVFLLAAFSYLKTSSVSTLALVQILGALLITLRLRFLPIVLTMSIVLPILSRRAISFWRSSRRFGINWINGLRFVFAPLLVSIILSQTLLFAYRHLYGELLDKPPAYTYRATNRFPRPAASTYAEYFDINRLKSNLQLEEGQFVDALSGETQAIRVALGIDVQTRRFASLTKKWENESLVWCCFLMILPLVFPVYLAINWRRIRTPHVVCGLCGLLLLLGAVVPVESPKPRYLTTLAWLAFIMIGCVSASVFGRLPRKRGHKKETVRT
jgi:hypothetical protein